MRETQGETAGGAAAEGVGGVKCQQINKGGRSGRARELSIAHWLTLGKEKRHERCTDGKMEESYGKTETACRHCG